MSGKPDFGGERRTTAHPVTADTTSVSTHDADRFDLTGSEIRAALLSAAGDPDVVTTRTDRLWNESEESLLVTIVDAETGTLVHAETNGADGELMDAYFTFDRKWWRASDVPRRLQCVPKPTDVALVYDDGEVHTRRTVTDRERQTLAEVTTLDASELTAVYDEQNRAFCVRSPETDPFGIHLNPGGDTSTLQHSTVLSLRSGNYTVERDVTGDDSAVERPRYSIPTGTYPR